MTERKVSSERVSALPPVDGLEVVAEIEGLIDAYWVLAFVEGREGRDKDTPEDAAQKTRAAISSRLSTLSQASSVIAGLTAERDEAIRRGEDQWAGWVKEEVARKAAEARISSLEAAVDAFADICDELGCERDNEAGLIAARNLKEEIKRLREALKQQIPGHRDPEGNCWCRYGHNPDYGHTLSCDTARQALGDHNG